MLFRLLLRPSIFSTSLTLLGAASLTAYSAWSYIENRQIWFDFVFGPYGVKTYIWQNDLALSGLLKDFSASPATYYVVLVGLGVIVALAVFTLLQLLTMGLRSTTSFLMFAQDAKTVSRIELFARLCLRSVAIAAWSTYVVYFIGSILPFSFTVNQIGVDDLQAHNLTGALLCTTCFAIVAAALHLHTIFLRLIALRPRVFGGIEDVEEARLT